DGSNRTKPDITAPGTGTRSCFNTADDAYVSLSGTSMATPHIAGAMALMWCARPDLRHDISDSRTFLDDAAHFISSTQCGTAGPPNNVYGWGRVDISAAVPAPGPLQCFPCWWQKTIAENFDGVTPPQLPPSWTAINAQGPPPLWVISDSGVPTPPVDTPPNSAFVDDPAVVSDKQLQSFEFSFFEGGPARLTFRNNFNLEASTEDPN